MDGPFEFPPVLLLGLFIAVAAVLAFISIFRQQQRRQLWTQSRACRACGQVHPPFARFCRRCGAKL